MDAGPEVLDNVHHERHEKFSFVPVSTVFPMMMGSDQMMEGMCFAAKLVAQERAQGHDLQWLRGFLAHYLGLDPEREEGFAKVQNMLIKTADQMLGCVQDMLRGKEASEIVADLIKAGSVDEQDRDTWQTRLSELAAYCELTGIDPLAYKEQAKLNKEDTPEELSGRDAVRLLFERLSMGYSKEEVAAELVAHGHEVPIEMFEAILSMVRASGLTEAQIYAMVSQEMGGDEGDALKMAIEDAIRANVKAQRHQVWRSIKAFQGINYLQARMGCLQIPLALVLFGGLFFTPLPKWLSALICVVVVAGSIIVRQIMIGSATRKMVKDILRTTPAESSKYVDAYRLVCRAEQFEEYREGFLNGVIKRLPEVDITLKLPVVPTTPLNGCFYTSNEKGMVKLPLTEIQKETFGVLDEAPWEDLDHELYWKSFYRIVMSALNQGYVAWNNASYWMFSFPQIGDNFLPLEGTKGMHFIEFSPNRLRHFWLDGNENDGLYERFKSLLDTCVYWGAGVGLNRTVRMTEKEAEVVHSNVCWTDELHQSLGAQYPLDSLPSLGGDA